MPYDIFISYSHRDNIAQNEGDGWVDSFHKALYRFLTGKLGREARIWRDATKMRGNYQLNPAVFENLKDSLILLPILSPNFLNSKWCPRELEFFCRHNNNFQGVESRVFPVVKTHIKAAPTVIGDNLLNEFFIRDDFGELMREIDPVFGGEYQSKFYLKISDLARDIGDFIERITQVKPADENPANEKTASPNVGRRDGNSEKAPPPSEPPPEDVPIIYLAEPSPDLLEQYNDIKRDLEQRRDLGQLKFNFLIPNQQKPAQAEKYIQIVREDIKKARLAVHLIGKEFDGFPRGHTKSYLQIQTEVAAERDADADFKRLVWIPRNITSEDEDQQAFIQKIRLDGVGSDGLMQDSFENFKSRVIEVLENKPAIPPGEEDTRWIYVLYDQSDLKSAGKLEKLLAEKEYAVLPASDYLQDALRGKPVNIVESHNDYLTRCDAVLIYWNNAPITWVRKNVFDLQGIKPNRGGKDFRAQAVFCDDLLSPEERERLSVPPPKNLIKVEGYSNLPQFFSRLS